MGGLPQIHKDPFDRILIAQALQNKMPLVSCDQQIRRVRRSMWSGDRPA